jgi:hypothetical protein
VKPVKNSILKVDSTISALASSDVYCAIIIGTGPIMNCKAPIRVLGASVMGSPVKALGSTTRR